MNKSETSSHTRAMPGRTSPPQSSIEKTTEAYDLLAPRYEELRRDNSILVHVAHMSQRLVEEAMQDCGFILEVGCGTGRETIPLARLGKRIVACDPSAESLRILSEKAHSMGLSDRIETRVLRASELHSLESSFGQERFDGGFSSFALAYEPTLDPIPATLSKLLKPNGPFFCSVYNRLCLTELLLLAPLLLPRRALCRLLDETLLSVGPFKVRLRSYTHKDVQSAFSPHFRLLGTWGLPAVLPPNYLHLLTDYLGGLRTALEDLDSNLSGRWPFRILGSHIAYLFRRGPSASEGSVSSL